MSELQLIQYREGTLPVSEVGNVIDHIGMCGECRTIAGAGTTVVSAAQQWEQFLSEQEHLTFEETAAYVESKLTPDERAAVLGHLQVCEMCREETADLARVVSRPRWRGKRAPLATAAAVAAAAASFFLVYQRQPHRHETHVAASGSQREPASEPASSEFTAIDRTLRGVAETLLAGHVPNRDLHRLLNQSNGVPRGGGDVRPAGSIIGPLRVIVDDRPTFSWIQRDPAPASVHIFDMSFNLVAQSPRLNATSWRVPATLRRGTTYQWQVVVYGARGDEIFPAAPAAPARFHIVGSEVLDELRAHASSLDKGLIFAREGLLEEAAQAFDDYQRSHPTSELAPRLAAAARRATSRSRRPETPPNSTDG